MTLDFAWLGGTIGAEEGLMDSLRLRRLIFFSVLDAIYKQVDRHVLPFLDTPDVPYIPFVYDVKNALLDNDIDIEAALIEGED